MRYRLHLRRYSWKDRRYAQDFWQPAIYFILASIRYGKLLKNYNTFKFTWVWLKKSKTTEKIYRITELDNVMNIVYNKCQQILFDTERKCVLNQFCGTCGKSDTCQLYASAELFAKKAGIPTWKYLRKYHTVTI